MMMMVMVMVMMVTVMMVKLMHQELGSTLRRCHPTCLLHRGAFMVCMSELWKG